MTESGVQLAKTTIVTDLTLLVFQVAFFLDNPVSD